MFFAVLYALLLAALFVRFRTDADVLPPEPPRPAPGEPVWLVGFHHALFYLLLFGCPLEAVLLGSGGAGRVSGAVVLALGVGLYRAAGGALGHAVSPFIEPRVGAPLVTRGLYRWVRHPMYVGQALIAVGAPLTLGCRAMLWLAASALVVLFVRVLLEDAALERTFPEYARYAARTKRILPFLY
jgi:protein-S-isoprenylcysteine O-methyltransferase Ste14